MKPIYLPLFLFLFLISCDSQVEKEYTEPVNTIPEISSFQFLEAQKEPNFEVIKIDSLKNFGALLTKMEQLSCKGKSIGLELTQNDTIYKLTGWSGCPEDASIGCYRANRIYIKNDSLRDVSENWNTMLPIQKLGKEVLYFTTKDYNFHYEMHSLKPALIELYIDDTHPIAKTKEVLKEITQVFKKINSENGKDYFRYTVLFTNFSWLDVPPPPPPPPAPEYIEEVEIMY